MTVPTDESPATVHTLVLHPLTLQGDRFVSSNPRRIFDAGEYSQFKYGSGYIAERYGYDLAELLIPHLQPMHDAGEAVTITGTPFKQVANAARRLALNVDLHLSQRGFDSVCGSIGQMRVAAGDYGGMSHADRDKRNQRKERLIDPAEFEGRHVVVVDDVRITGSIERSVIKSMQELQVLSLTMLHLAMMDPALVAVTPRIEAKLNHVAISSLDDLARLALEDESHSFTARSLKFILDQDPEDIARFLARTDRFTSAVYSLATDDGYDRMPEYSESFKVVEQFEFARQIAVRRRRDLSGRYAHEDSAPSPSNNGFKLSSWLQKLGL